MKHTKKINNSRNGYHFNSKYWQKYKQSLPALPQHLFEVAVGMMLGDASIYKVSREAYIKFEQGHKQDAFARHLFEIFKTYCFMEQPGIRIKAGKTKSYWFKTFSHKSFTRLWELFCKNKRKAIHKNLIVNHLTPRGLAYWIMCDGSLQSDRASIILHTQSYTQEENFILSSELNAKFGLKTKVITHKQKYWVIKTHPADAALLHLLCKPYIITSMEYKLPTNVLKT